MTNYKYINKIDFIKSLPPKIIKLKEDVMRLVFDIAFRKKVFYHELFASYLNQINQEQFKNKILFKLKRIIDKEFKDIDAKIYLNLKDGGQTKENSYILPLTFVIMDDKEIKTSWNQKFIWFNFPQEEYKLEQKNVKKEAEKFLLSINKSMFFGLTNCKGQDLFDYIKGMLQTISLDLKITPYWQNMDGNLKTMDFQIHVYLNDKWIFDVSITDKESLIKYYGKGDDKKQKNQIIKNQDLISQSQIESYWDMVIAKMQRQLSDVWDSQDTIGEVVKSAQFILYKLFGNKVVEQISITTNKKNDTKLVEIINQDSVTAKSKIDLDFQWIIIGYNFKLVYDNIKLKVIQLEYENPKNKIINVISKINLKNKFLELSQNLFWVIANELNNISYTLSLKSKWNNLYLKTKDVHLLIYVYWKEPWLMNIELYLKYYGNFWLFSAPYDDTRIKIRDEL